MVWLCGAFTCFCFIFFFQKSPIARKKIVSEIRLREAAASVAPVPETTTNFTESADDRAFVIVPPTAYSARPGPANTDQEIPNIPVRLRRSLLDSGDQKFFHALNDIVHHEYYVIPNVPLSRIVSFTEKSISVQLLKRLRSHGLKCILVEKKSLKIALGISIPLHQKQSLIFEAQVLTAAKLPHLILSRDQEYPLSDLEGLVRAKLMPASARLLHPVDDDSQAIGV